MASTEKATTTAETPLQNGTSSKLTEAKLSPMRKSKNKSSSRSSERDSDHSSSQKKKKKDGAKKAKTDALWTLDDELVARIVNELDFVTKIKLGLCTASTKSRERVKKLIRASLDLSNLYYQFDDDIIRLMIMNWYDSEETTSVIIRQMPRLTERVLKTITTYLPNLMKLDLQSCVNIRDEGFKNLSKLTNLTSLSIAHTPANEKYLKAIAKSVTSLTHLNISECNHLTTKCIPSLLQLGANLLELDISRCYLVNDEFIGHLSSLPKLTQLKAAWLYNVEDDGFNALATGNIVVSDAEEELTSPNSDGPPALATNLRYLDISGNVLKLGWCERLTDSGIATAIKHLTRLNAVHLEYTRVDRETQNVLASIVSSPKRNLNLIVASGTRMASTVKRVLVSKCNSKTKDQLVVATTRFF